MKARRMSVHTGRHVGWWAEGRFAGGRLFMMTWWPYESWARAVARLFAGGSPVRFTGRARDE